MAMYLGNINISQLLVQGLMYQSYLKTLPNPRDAFEDNLPSLSTLSSGPLSGTDRVSISPLAQRLNTLNDLYNNKKGFYDNETAKKGFANARQEFSLIPQRPGFINASSDNSFNTGFNTSSDIF